jgi:DNA-binding response OmpR family regulator
MKSSTIHHPSSIIHEGEKPLLLIVEDNTDMRSYIREYFEEEYEIIEAEDGAEGYEKAIENIPDIIISDVMMPNMDGNEFSSKVKMDERSSHIPVILLTARASKESRIEGLETGADDFITKPFDGEELQVRVKNLIELRQRLQVFFRRDLETIREDKLKQDLTIDEKFLLKAKTMVERNLSDPDYSVKDFASDMALSRVQLYRKLSALLDISVTVFIRNVRLNKAAEFLKKKTATISEIAYDTGFSSPSYFSSSFHNYFGVSPTEYQELEDES